MRDGLWVLGGSFKCEYNIKLLGEWRAISVWESSYCHSS